MNNELKFLLAKYDSKMASLWQLDGQLLMCEDDHQAWHYEKRQRIVQAECDAVRAELVAKIKELTRD